MRQSLTIEDQDLPTDCWPRVHLSRPEVNDHPAVVGFLELNYRCQSVTMKIPNDVELAPIPILAGIKPVQHALNYVITGLEQTKTHTHTDIYIYIYIWRERERERERQAD